jgi:hypothetical protein
MTISQDNLTRLLKECGVEPLPPLKRQKETAIPFILREGGESIHVLAFLINDGRIVQFRTLNLVRASGQRHRAALLTGLLRATLQYKLVKFTLDFNDGEVIAYIDMFLGDAEFTRRQCRRCIDTLRRVVVPSKKRFEKLAQTGVDPGPGDQRQALQAARETLEARIRNRGAADKPSPSPLSGAKKKPPSRPSPRPQSPTRPQRPDGGNGDSPGGFDGWLDDLLDDDEG